MPLSPPVRLHVLNHTGMQAQKVHKHTHNGLQNVAICSSYKCSKVRSQFKNNGRQCKIY